ncbi:MAG: cupin domain-containing protein, partial [bacterium]
MAPRCPLVHIDEVEPEKTGPGGGPAVVDLRFPISRRQGVPNSAFLARFHPGATALKHRHDGCDELVYILSGRGRFGPDGVEVRPGHVRFIPRGGEHWLRNMRAAEPLDVLALFPGGGSRVETRVAGVG